MEESKKEIYFSHDALARFVTAEGKIVEAVICHLWQNNLDPNNPVEIIDNIELHFTDKQKLTIACNEDGEALDAIDFDAPRLAKELKEQFGGKIKLFKVDASPTKMWTEVIGKTLENIRVTKQGEYYLADSVILNFGEEKRVVSIGPQDGLIIDYWEED